MNRERAKQLLPIIKAFSEGETVQLHDGDGIWADIDGETPQWFDELEYRIKPKKRIGFVHLSDIHTGCHGREDCIKMVEVDE